MHLKKEEIIEFRIQNQLLRNSGKEDVRDIVAHMGAIQAQDFAMAKWAIGIRGKGIKEKDVDIALEKGRILRTHLLRPTWHLVSGEDVHWLTELTAPQIITRMRSRQKQLGLTHKLIEKSNELIRKELTDKKFAKREELTAVLEAAGFDPGDNRMAYLLIFAELGGIISSGPFQGNVATYSLLKSKTQSMGDFNRGAALEELTRRYFRSHGPATLGDFIWWSGLKKTEARKSLEGISDNLSRAKCEDQEFWYYPEESRSGEARAWLLPSYDEFYISYKDRSILLDEKLHKSAVSENGVFRPMILAENKIYGTWKRALQKNKVIIECNFFSTPSKKIRSMIEDAAGEFALFMGINSEVRYNDA